MQALGGACLPPRGAGRRQRADGSGAEGKPQPGDDAEFMSAFRTDPKATLMDSIRRGFVLGLKQGSTTRA